VPVLAYGMPVFATAGGSATSDTTAWVEAPASMRLPRPACRLSWPERGAEPVGRGFGACPWCQREAMRARRHRNGDQRPHGRVGLQKLLPARATPAADAIALESRIRGPSASLFVAARRRRLELDRSGLGQRPHQFGSGCLALSAARSSGHRVPRRCSEALNFLRQQLAPPRIQTITARP